MFYNGVLNGNNFGQSEYYSGNSFLSLDFTVGVPPLPVVPEIKPYGFVGNAYNDTHYQVHKGLSYGCTDNRPIPDVALLKEARGSSQAYSTLFDDQNEVKESSYTHWNGAVLRNITKYVDPNTNVEHYGWGIEQKSIFNTPSWISVNVPNEDINYLVLYSYLLNILNNLFEYIDNLKHYIALHKHTAPPGGGTTSPPNSPPPNNDYYDGSGYTNDSTKMKTYRS